MTRIKTGYEKNHSMMFPESWILKVETSSLQV
jgi:hypothetical protein